MKIYADVEFYMTDFLLGREPAININEFMFWANKASRTIDLHTFSRLTTIDEIPEAVKHCCCAIAEIQFTQAESLKPDNVTSESVGAYSVSYAKTALDDVEFATAINNQLREYLTPTGLLFGGVR